MAAVDKTYGDALFSLVTEEDEKGIIAAASVERPQVRKVRAS